MMICLYYRYFLDKYIATHLSKYFINLTLFDVEYRVSSYSSAQTEYTIITFKNNFDCY